MKIEGKFAARAIRQYRSRDIFAYLSLRYLLASDFARTNQFARMIAPQVTRSIIQSTYLAIPYFKERGENGSILYRDMHFPTAIEALAEAALIDHCANRASVPDREICFSYWPTMSHDSSGYFEPYMTGLKARQAAVTRAIEESESATIVYVDIKKFYPSIKSEYAKLVWNEFHSEFKLDDEYFLLGKRIIEKQSNQGDGAIVTGPMFSHFLGNLALGKLDKKCKGRTAKFFRYVDDFIIVGSTDLSDEISWLIAELKDLGFDAHGPESEKSLKVDGRQWLKSSRDFESGELSVAWMRLVGDIKKQLLIKPNTGGELHLTMLEHGFRLPMQAYETAVREATTFERVRELRIWGWLKAKARKVSIDSILNDAKQLRDKIESQIVQLLEMNGPDDAFERKRRVTKLRYRLGRSLYLSEPAFMERILGHRAKWPELEVHFALMASLETGLIDDVIEMGGNVSQAAAQLFSASGETARLNRKVEDPAQRVGLAVFLANGVPCQTEEVVDSPLLQFATGPIDASMFSRLNGFLRDAACLHGVGAVRHSQVMQRAYDVAEEIHFDAISLDYGYSF